mgnify:CR=1 FL=1
MSKKVVQALYNDDDVLLSAVKKVRQANLKIEEVYTPFPVHGLDKAYTNCHSFIHLRMYRISGCYHYDEVHHD